MEGKIWIIVTLIIHIGKDKLYRGDRKLTELNSFIW